MSEPPQGGPAEGGDGEAADVEPAAAAEQRPAPAEPHDPSGLGLARSVAASLGATARNRPRRRTRPRTERVVGPGPQVSGAHPDDRDPQRLGAAVERLVDSKGWTTEVDARSLLARWPSLVGPTNAAHSHPEAFADTVLTVRTDSTAWATQLRMLAPQLVALLNGALGDGTVTRVDVRGPDGPTWKKGRLSVRDGRGPRDTYG
ncbi:Predicted nucleic acid-binding protein, contains Zn-ribbon domain (includes truncated derivatives) [Friedmanniella luteola]|uniref:Predicted nucleic acid-binding protein, contains Zn-ribbon domain (Includes truncated derivatives) n=1 Tax=Friedmanniella luteola TaxID=546871 RepID=A0A1H2A9U7_9ACTN|nr:DciA family protein [Friedmanniella luteola]SDT42721.1 Predicted nucleic acid-binding protein, contains Zn-ribbon domain (includes truncated derivatives) [Friedmanniella luteola]